ncbi:LacI family DNA-binding transcriptional regulator [Agromyces seonyuensis]|uniref:LacI family DNA-binding transcriptional regulator n=1 Tax=Agromyces seonyuensis TaxID=2662446 RepID=A0A6I4P4P3_9MICO|nr:LacI family DNA-binding transcriptional regulator [Agromyces seonyuensis]MWB98407.1 LacI family DNA-binding transcriptional regulator [Agromyces seonyuensis]
MVATSEDVARRAGVSRGAVSQILNGRGARFSAGTRERVQLAAAELDYRPSVAGRALARGSSDIVIALIPDTTFGGNLQDLFESMTDEFAGHGLTLLLRLSGTSTTSLDHLLTGIKPRAVLSLTGFSDEERAVLEERGIRGLESPAPTGGSPIHDIAKVQARHLIDRGHRRLAFAHLRDERQEFYGRAREEAFAAVCLAEGLPAPEVLSLDLGLPDAVEALRMLPARGFGVACYNDEVAIALLAAAREIDWAVPDDLAIIGMDHLLLGQLTSPPLTTIEYDQTTVAEGAGRWALAVLEQPSEVSAEAPPLQLRIIQGGTT